MYQQLAQAGIWASALLQAAPAAPAECVPPKCAKLNVLMCAQETTMWCWAASAQMIMKTVGNQPISQCVQADTRFMPARSASCCDGQNKHDPKTCNRRGWPEFPKFNFSCMRCDRALSWDELRCEIGMNQRPVAFSYEDTEGGGDNHMMVAYGYRETKTLKRLLWVMDPFPPGVGEEIPDYEYDDYLRTPTQKHLRDYLQVVKAASRPMEIRCAQMQVVVADRKTKADRGESSQSKREGLQVPMAIEKSRAMADKELEDVRATLMDDGSEDAKTLRVGQPLGVIWIGLNDVRQAKGEIPAQLTENISTVVRFPLISSGRIVRAIEVHSNHGKWDVATRSNTVVARLLVAQKEAFSKTWKISPEKFYEVAIPGLNLYFAATNHKLNEGASGIALIPAINYPSMELTSGVPIDAKTAFPRICKAAIELQEQEGAEKDR